jgi:hypothetical protein
MKVFINCVKGFNIIKKNVRLVVLLFIVNLLFSLILAVPMYTALQESMGQSEVGERMARGFDFLWWEEFRDLSRGLESTFSPSVLGKGAVLDNFVNLINWGEASLPPVILFFVFFYIIVHTFLSGGVLTVLKSDPPQFSLRFFFAGAGKHFIRFVLLLLLSSIFFLAVFGLQGFFFQIVDSVSETARSEIPPFYLALVFSALTYVLFLFFQMVFDYARITTVIEDRRNILLSTRDAFGFVFKHLGSTLGLFYLLLLANLGTTVIYILIKEILPQSSAFTVSAAFVVQQLFICAIIWIRCWLYSSQLELYRYIK